MMVLLPLQGASAAMMSAGHPARAAEGHVQEADAAPQMAADHACHHGNQEAPAEKPTPSDPLCADSLCCHLSSAPAMALPGLPAVRAENAYDLFPIHPHLSHIPEQPQRPPLA